MESLAQKIRNLEIWLIGNRCDGWEKESVQKRLHDLRNELTVITFSQPRR